MNEIVAFFGNYPLLNMLFFTKIRNHVDKYVITKHYYQLMPLSLATLKRQGSYGYGEALGVASGYASGQIKICIFPQATPKAFYCTIFDLRALGVASGYALGQIKICIFPQATP
ncbi:hypothetical protein T12_8306 [Trichinella patagoniensis]|uniref:Uncharacterized protein n=1 Tax=Trichinella patagoniensis TaxID=990121 RepID=A0A0V0Z403_9BILA|nr:hypothetical protein T12_8306 [Trichinella patagoniensis]